MTNLLITNGWVCRARPAGLNGKPCGHVNPPGLPKVVGRIGSREVACCEECGCTKAASDDRAQREALTLEPRR